MSQFDDVADFHNKFKFPTTNNGSPCQMDRAEQKFRIKCLYEELHEYENAVAEQDLPEQFDALLDLIYFALGTLDRQNLPFDHGFDRVHQANMGKLLGPNGIEIIKPDGWKAPVLTDLIAGADLYSSLKNNTGLITIDGPDGTGKTTLAKRAAALFGGEHIHLTWSRSLDKVMNDYRSHAIGYASALAKHKVVVLERPWLSHPIYARTYRNDERLHDFRSWRITCELEQAIGVMAIPLNRHKWFADYLLSCETRNEHYAEEAHSKMREVFHRFEAVFEDKQQENLNIWPLDRATHIRYDYQQVNPGMDLDLWIIDNLQLHLGKKL